MPDLATLTFAGASFGIRRDDPRPAWFLFGVRKSGSSIMNAMGAALAGMNGVNYVDVAGKLFETGVAVPAWQRDPGMGALLAGGNLYGGFRNAPLAIAGHPLLRAGRAALLVRDPRDALVSEYFSNAYSHSVPAGGEARDLMLEQRATALRAPVAEYVRRMAPALRETLREYRPFLGNPNLKLYRYESAIIDKGAFLRDLCEHFGWTATDHQISLILGWADVIPAEENPTRFVRKVVPGDHREKLDPATIDALDGILAEELRLFGYAPHGA
ncbi:hypothetical protein [Falsiroseomonas sp. CW058]|uniref:hypothetical protein n=1 Tax=Falsiroseomonas sp. CW058 TaxID=3388664 RepID=UPI003D319CD3